jgi:hypothetical protein
MWRVTPIHTRMFPLDIKLEDWLLMWWATTPHIKYEEWILSTLNVKSDYSLRQFWRVTPLHTKMLRVTPLHKTWRVILLHAKCEEWLLSTGSDSSIKECLLSTSNVKSDYSPSHMWWVPILHIRCEKWLLSTTNVKSECSLRLNWRVTPNMMSNSKSKVKSYSLPYQICRVTPIYANMKGDSSPRQMWRVIPLLIICEEGLHI